MDYLGIVIAFITVMLLLSIVVMGLVQLTQAALRLRGRNLTMGIAGLMMSDPKASINKNVDEAEKQSLAHRTHAKNEAANLLNDEMFPLIGRAGHLLGQSPKGDPIGTVRNVLLGAQRSWIEPGDLEYRLVARGVLESDDASAFAQRFEKTGPLLQDRFLLITRWWTAVWALLVAVTYQVSTPSLINELIEDPAKRERLVQMGETLNEQADSILAAFNYELVGMEALDEMKRQFPQHFEIFDELVATGWDRSELVGEMEIAVEALPDAEGRSIVARYDQILRDNMDRYAAAAARETRRANDRLSQVGIRFWSEGWDYYFDDASSPRLGNWLGTLMTAILLSLGAPFWFEQLKNATQLRDLLDSSKGRKQKDNQAE